MCYYVACMPCCKKIIPQHTISLIRSTALQNVIHHCTSVPWHLSPVFAQTANVWNLSGSLLLTEGFELCRVWKHRGQMQSLWFSCRLQNDCSSTVWAQRLMWRADCSVRRLTGAYTQNVSTSAVAGRKAILLQCWSHCAWSWQRGSGRKWETKWAQQTDAVISRAHHSTESTESKPEEPLNHSRDIMHLLVHFSAHIGVFLNVTDGTHVVWVTNSFLNIFNHYNNGWVWSWFLISGQYSIAVKL